MKHPDEELDTLIDALLNGTLSDSGRAKLEQRLRDDPEAIRKAAEAVRFEVELADAIRPDHVEVFQQRRMVIDPSTGRPVMVESIERVEPSGFSGGGSATNAPRARRTSVLKGAGAVCVLLALAGMALHLLRFSQEEETQWAAVKLKNPGFEQPPLPAGSPDSADTRDWQDFFRTPNATIGRMPEGAAHGGAQFARLHPGGHVKQLLTMKDGSPVVFEPGMKVRVSGWAKPEGDLPVPAQILQLSLHFVNDAKATYVACYRVIPLDNGGWRRFSAVLTVPESLMLDPSFMSEPAGVTDVTGKPVLLNLINLSAGTPPKVTFLLDDIGAEVRSPRERE
jgi:hypothetical protein